MVLQWTVDGLNYQELKICMLIDFVILHLTLADVRKHAKVDCNLWQPFSAHDYIVFGDYFKITLIKLIFVGASG